MICFLQSICKKDKLLFTFLLLLPLFIYSQTANEKLKQELNKFKTTENPREGINDLLSFLDIVPKSTDSLQGQYYLNIGIAYGQINHADSSFWYLNKAEKIARKTKSDFLLAMIYNTRGLVFMGKANYEASLNAYQEVMKISESKNDPQLQDVLSKTYGNLGGVYYQLGQKNKALETTKKGLALSEKIHDTTDIAMNHLRLAIVYNELNNLDKGVYHLQQARIFFKDLNDSAMLVYAEKNLGKIFLKQQQLDSASTHYELAHQYATNLGEQEEYLITLLDIANVRLEQNKLTEAEKLVQNALELAKKNGYAHNEQKAYDLLYKIALKKGNIQEALTFRNKFIVVKDSLGNVEVKERVAELETQFETAKKEKEIQKLTFENQLNDANLKKARNELIILSVSGVSIIIVLLLFFIARYKKVKAEREAQALQVEALQKRFMELHSSPSELSVDLQMNELNHKLQTPLTDREFEALKLCVTGKSNTDIAEQLYVSVSTVKFHLRNAYSKLGVNNRKEAFKFVLESI